MISIVSATNRNQSITRIVSETYRKLLEQHGNSTLFFHLESVPGEFLNDGMYRKAAHGLRDFGHSIFNSADEFVMIMPEYNGSFPGVLKLVIDACNPDIFIGKRFALVGVASGRAGNLRGMDHMTDILHYLKAEVYSQKLPISQIRNLLDSDFKLSHEPTLEAMQKHILGFKEFSGRFSTRLQS
ncbi:MAG: NAD(P)H-dependent oxidoreductase [Bacteroidetes bacterium]|nr:NAD(P)H-dependent oxidoreductase [Bacteroidota bacterium]